VKSSYDLKSLTQVCEVLSGGTPKTTVPKFWNGNIPWASVKDFNIDSRWFSKTEKFISQLGLDNCSSVLLEIGDLVISARGTVGVVGQCKMRTSFNQSSYGLRAKKALSNNDYLYYALSYAKRALIGDSHGGMFDTITRDTLDRLLIPVPTLKVQEQIVEILGSLDEKIAVNNALSKTLEDIAQTIFKSWFIDFDPVRAKMAGEKPEGMDDATAALFPDSMVDSEMGLIPKGWRVGSLEEIVDLQGGYAFKSSSWTDCGVPVIKIGSVKPGYVDLTQVSYVDTSLAEEISDDYRIPAGSLVVGLTGYVGQVGLVRTHDPVPLVNQRVAKFKSRSGDWKIPFIYCFTRDPKFKVIVEELATGTAQQNVSNSQILSIPLVLPNSEIQKSFEDSLTPLFNQIINLADENESLKSLRDALLPRLISGELQIPNEMLAS